MQVEAVMVRPGRARPGWAGRGAAGKAVEARLRRRVKSRSGEAVTASPVGAGSGRKARPGVAMQGSLGTVGMARLVEAMQGSRGVSLPGSHGWRGQAMQGSQVGAR